MKYIKILTISAVFFVSSATSLCAEETKFVKELRDKIRLIFQEYEDLFFKKTIVKPDEDKEKDHDKKDCECGGDGIITHGDGHSTPCPCEICDCKKKGDAPVTKPTIIMLSQKSCPPCIVWKNSKEAPLKKAGWDVIILNIDNPQDAETARQLGLSTSSTPKFYVTINNKKYSKVGSLEYSDLEKYKKDAYPK